MKKASGSFFQIKLDFFIFLSYITPMLNHIEKQIIASIQGDMPITARPYLELSESIGISEETFIETLKDLCERGIIRRFGATIRHQISGFRANAMVAWQVDENYIHEAGEKMAGAKNVSHCYSRNPAKDWPYNLYTMIHGASEEECQEIASSLSKETGIDTYTILFSRRELKKTSMQYFADLDD